MFKVKNCIARNYKEICISNVQMPVLSTWIKKSFYTFVTCSIGCRSLDLNKNNCIISDLLKCLSCPVLFLKESPAIRKDINMHVIF